MNFPSGPRGLASHWRYALVLLVVLVMPLSACASLERQPADEYANEVYDPLEPMNRAIFRFNDRADRLVIRPAAEAFMRLPSPVRTGVGNFWSNLTYPFVITNSLLQGKGRQGLSDTGRFLVNSTVGVLGIFDPASGMGLERNREDFGQTLAVWGVGDGPYLVLPLLGPSNARDATGLGLTFATRGLLYPPFWVDADTAAQVALLATGVVDERARLLPVTRMMEQTGDPYVFARESYRQRREYLIHDGAPPMEDDFFFDDD